MGNYGVRGNVTAIQMGPVITTFEFAPVPGTRTGKIVQLENDLAMALEAQSVRIVPHPGQGRGRRGTPEQEARDGVPQGDPRGRFIPQGTSKLQICMGKDTKGAPVSVNLAKMPTCWCRHHRVGQVRRGQRNDHQHSLLGHAGRSALHHGGPQAARAVDLRGHPSLLLRWSWIPRRRRWRCAGGRRDGASLRAAFQERCARHL